MSIKHDAMHLGFDDYVATGSSGASAGNGLDVGPADTVRIIISPTRSGSTALLRCFENNPAVDAVLHQPIKSGHREGNDFDYSIFTKTGQDSDPKLYIAKETVGGFEHTEAVFSPFPNAGKLTTIGPWLASEQEINLLEPLVLLRDPLQTWGSIARLNTFSAGKSSYHSPFEYFETSYRRIVEFALAAHKKDLRVKSITQEMLGANPEGILTQISRYWGFEYHAAMVRWTIPYGERTWFSNEARSRMNTDPRFQKSKESLLASTSYDYRPSSTDHISDQDRIYIERELRPLYEAVRSIAHKDFSS